jgi:hypothetical protein
MSTSTILHGISQEAVIFFSQSVFIC